MDVIHCFSINTSFFNGRIGCVGQNQEERWPASLCLFVCLMTPQKLNRLASHAGDCAIEVRVKPYTIDTCHYLAWSLALLGMGKGLIWSASGKCD